MLKNIGRNNKNEIVLSQAEISNFHAQLILDDDNNIFINDLNSENGTYVNGNSISEPTQLKKGDIVKIAGVPLHWEPHVPYSPTSIGLDRIDDPPRFAPKKKSALFYFGISLLITFAVLTCGYLINESMANDEGKESTDTDSNEESDSNIDNNIADCKNTDYDYSCLGDEEELDINEPKNQLDDIFRQTIDVAFDVEVTVEEEEEAGEECYRKMKNDYKFLKHDNRLDELKSILSNLEREIPNKMGFNYQIFLVKNKENPDMLNAFTMGGKIYFTTAMFDFCKNEDERASIIGHEINHNELGHINEKIKIIKASEQILPGSSEISYTIYQILNTPFNSKNEAECDLHGIDLCVCAGYKHCSTADVWNRMKEGESEYNVIESLFRTHPYSQKREDCAKHHIQSNYQIDCD